MEPKLTRHHLNPRCRRNGRKRWKGVKPGGILRLTYTRHQMWHILFRNRTLAEIIAVLQRIQRK